MSGQSYLITGGTGFLGHGLVGHLLRAGAERIRVYSRSEVQQFHLRARYEEAFPGDARLGFFVGDVRDLDRLERAMQMVDIVIHAAALKRIEVGYYNPDEMVKTNVNGTLNVIEAARRAGVRRVVYVSSDKAFEPVSPYGLTKALGEELALAAERQHLGPEFRVVRYGNVAGSTGSVIPIWRERIANGLSLRITDPDCTRFWMSAQQAVELVMSATVGDQKILIPQLPAYRLGDLALALLGPIGHPDTKIEFLGLQQWEKKHESMGPGNCSASAPRLSIEDLRALLEEIPAQ